MSSLAASSATGSRKAGDGTAATRRLAAILLMDVAGYSRLVSEDETATLTAFKGHLRELIRPEIAQHEGRVVKTTGDGLLAEFASAVQAVACASKVQREMTARNAATPKPRRIEFRVGINLAEVVFEDGDVFGDGVNVAARLETLSEPGGICLSEDVYRYVRGKVGVEFEDLGAKTLKGIADPMRIYRAVISSGSAVRPRPDDDPERAQPQLPRVAVLPFDNLSGDPEQGYFSDGITNELITDLSKFSELAVIASHSVFAYKGKTARIDAVARDLGASYIVEGSVQRAGESVRINVQLIDAAGGIHLWSERYKRPLNSLFDLYDEIVDRLVATLATRVEMSERERASRKPTESLEAYDHCLRGKELWYSWEKDANEAARAHFEQAVKLDPNFAQAYRNLSYILVQGCLGGWIEPAQETIRRARHLAERALALGPADFENYGQLAFVSLYCRDFDRSLALYRKAIDMNPNSPDLLADMGDALVHVGRTAEGVAMIAQAQELNPLSSDWYDWVLGIAAFQDGRYEDALDLFNRVGNASAFLCCDLAATLVRLGRLDEAHAVVDDLLRRQPDYRLRSEILTPFKDPQVLQRFMADLRLAGIPG